MSYFFQWNHSTVNYVPLATIAAIFENSRINSEKDENKIPIFLFDKTWNMYYFQFISDNLTAHSFFFSFRIIFTMENLLFCLTVAMVWSNIDET